MLGGPSCLRRLRFRLASPRQSSELVTGIVRSFRSDLPPSHRRLDPASSPLSIPSTCSPLPRGVAVVAAPSPGGVAAAVTAGTSSGAAVRINRVSWLPHVSHRTYGVIASRWYATFPQSRHFRWLMFATAARRRIASSPIQKADNVPASNSRSNRSNVAIVLPFLLFGHVLEAIRPSWGAVAS